MQPYVWTFLIADVSQPLLGADFFKHHTLLVDVKHRKLINIVTLTSVPAFPSEITTTRFISSISQNDQYTTLLKSFPTITTPSFSLGIPKNQVKHYIVTKGPPLHAHARRFSPDKLAAAKVEFETMEELKIIRRSNSPWASPLHVAP